MAQLWNDNTYQGNHIIETDMINIENNFECLKSMFSGDSVPPNADESGMPWYETDLKIQRYRNYNTSAWLCLLPLDSDQRIWHYRNDAPDGLIVDAGAPTDRVVAVRSTSGNYNITPGSSMASWISPSHTHGAGTYTVNTRHRHGMSYASGGYFYIDTALLSDYRGSTSTPLSGSSASGGKTSTWRPAAAVGVLLKLDI